MSLIDNIISDNNIHSFEGERGVKNLCRLCREIGYFDRTYFGQISHNSSYGDLIEFLQDNPGAVEAVVDFIRENFDEEDDEDEDDVST